MYTYLKFNVVTFGWCLYLLQWYFSHFPLLDTHPTPILYPHFVRDSQKQQQLQAQYLQQKRIHDSNGSSESFQVGDRIWLYTPVVNQGHTRKFASFWKGPYTVIDKPSEVTYKIQLIGGTQMLLVHRNRLKPCFTPPQLQADTLTGQHPRTTPDRVPTYADVAATGYHMPQVGGYTSIEPDHPTTRSARVRRPPARYDEYLRH